MGGLLHETVHFYLLEKETNKYGTKNNFTRFLLFQTIFNSLFPWFLCDRDNCCNVSMLESVMCKISFSGLFCVVWHIRWLMRSSACQSEWKKQFNGLLEKHTLESNFRSCLTDCSFTNNGALVVLQTEDLRRVRILLVTTLIFLDRNLKAGAVLARSLLEGCRCSRIPCGWAMKHS